MIRIRYPNDYILQATFKSNEPYAELYKFVQECLEYNSVPFELFGHSMKKSMTMNSSLAEAGLAPSAMLNFRWTEESLSEASRLGLNFKIFLKHSLIEKAVYLQD